jgi:hypothetical protein
MITFNSAEVPSPAALAAAAKRERDGRDLAKASVIAGQLATSLRELNQSLGATDHSMVAARTPTVRLLVKRLDRLLRGLTSEGGFLFEATDSSRIEQAQTDQVQYVQAEGADR